MFISLDVRGSRARMGEGQPSLWQQIKTHPIKLLKSWISVSLIGGLVATAFDLGLVIALVQLAHFNPAAAAPLGVTLGATVNFFINKLFAFKDSDGHTGLQLLRFLGGTMLAAGVHAGLVHLLTNKLGLFYVFSKLIADVLVFSVGNLLLLRFFVFPKNRATQSPGTDGSGEGRSLAPAPVAAQVAEKGEGTRPSFSPAPGAEWGSHGRRDE
jgi:putative flippase GtrA